MRINFSIVLALSATAVLAGCGEAPTPTKEVAPATPQALTQEQSAAIDTLTTEKLIGLVRTGSGPEFTYADERLANILKETSDEDLIRSVTDPRLPFGQAMYQANMAKARLSNK